MSCPSCGRDSRADARFCDGCGARLGASRAVRDRPAYTPKHLAQKILTQRSALEGERKQVTVFFADIKSSLELAAEVDPEEWHRLLDRFFAVLADGVHRYEGTVNQYTGDGIMALFGAPIAHEDHAQRACYAALRLQSELRRYAQQLRRERGLDFHVRMGLNSGEVVVGKIGDDLRMDYTAQGHTVGLAQRMEALAEPGRVYLTEDTARLVAGYFALEDLGEFKIKGAAGAVEVYALEGRGSARTRLEVARARGLTRFVGRARDLARLDDALERALAGRGEVVAIAGGAGVGKSRLCLEFTERCHARGLAVHAAHGLAHAQSIPYLPVLEYLRGAFEIGDADDDLRTRQRIAGALLLIDPDLADDLPLIFDFLGVADPANPAPRLEGEGRERRLAAVLTRFHRARAAQSPLVVVFEDLHWLDRGSRGFVAYLARSLVELRALLVVNFRPEFEGEWLADPGVERIDLGPLGPAELDELLRDLLGSDASIAPLAARIRDRAGGNPFFAEEIVQSLVDAGALAGSRGAYRLTDPGTQPAIPSTLHALVSSRIDRLSEPEKRLLQTAAVIGKAFAEPVLRKVAELPDPAFARALQGLTGADFICEQALEPEPVYEFRHPITQEITYQSQLSDQRAAVHAAIARALEEGAADSEDRDAAVIAHHWEQAGNAFAAARWTHRAARWIGASNPAEAMALWRKLLELLQDAPATPEGGFLGARACRWLLFLGAFQGMPEDEAEALLSAGRAYSESTRDNRSLAVTVGNYGAYQAQVAVRPQRYVECAEDAVRIAARSGDARSDLAAGVRLVQAYHMAGRFADAVERGEAALARFEAPDGPRTDPLDHVTLYASTGDSLVELGRLDAAVERIQRGLRFAAEHDLQLNAGSCHNVMARLAATRGERATAESHARDALRIAEKTGNRAQRVYASDALGLVHQLAGRWTDAVSAGEQAIAAGESFGVGQISENAHRAHLAMSYLGLGDERRARAMAEAAVRASERCGPRYTPRAHLALAAVLLAADGLEARAAIESALDDAASSSEATGAAVYAPFIAEERARLSSLAGDAERARDLLRDARRAYRRLAMTPHADRLDRELHRLV